MGCYEQEKEMCLGYNILRNNMPDAFTAVFSYL